MTTKTHAEAYGESMRKLHGEDVFDRMLVGKPPAAAPAPAAVPFPGHYMAHGRFETQRK